MRIATRLCWALLCVLAIGGAASAQDSFTIAGAITTHADAMTFLNASVPLNAAATRFLYAFGAEKAGAVRLTPAVAAFPSTSPFGMNGRSLYARLGWTF